ncbi:hypothetical protein Poli38472_006355 [Pythium oligandrum]|uniref:Protein kinase domain-containing protein n=1 Tax=Pythium oligandrum TaxID=41045 RepID=A0A8K1C4P8_PYTOL|nr:hypothetical protein Poli38472_006355 [Pythium oligandrum]|eukprot:TMW56345.1 hypothetical protein Poli38472_006355 [Pythium oligandrum]
MKMRAAMLTLVLCLGLATCQVSVADGVDFQPPRPPPDYDGDSSGAMFNPFISDMERMVEDKDALLVVMDESSMPPPPPGAPPGPPPIVCDGQPAIMTRSSQFAGNNGCFPPDVVTNLSCSCLIGFNETNEWVFRLQEPTQDQVGPPHKELPGSDVLGVTAVLLMGIPATVTSFKIVADTEKPLPLDILVPPGPPGHSDGSSNPVLVRAPFKNALDSVEVANVDFARLPIKPGFLPSSVRSLSLRNCQITRISSDFLNDFQELTSLDISQNQLSGIFQDVTPTTCTNSHCTLKALNLSHNAITSFPSYLLYLNSLETLDLTTNSISNVTVDNATFDALTQLKVFRMDTVTNGSDCASGTFKTVQNAILCVPTGSSSEDPEPAPTEPDDSSPLLIYIIIGGSLVIAALLFILLKKRPWRKSEDKDILNSYFESTVGYDDTTATVSATLLNDPIIVTHRIPYKDVRVANCISKGGFGLVYSGVYNRRRVAVKKIRPDRAGDIKQIELFLREICMMATLSHPRIVEFIGVSWDSLRNICAITEYMDRGDLREVLHGFKLRNQQLTWESHKTIIAMHIAEALTYLHSLNPKVIHRDLKSKNVLLDSDLNAKLSDFGISRERHFEETHMTAGIGTSFWIAPEVLVGKDYDERADIFSFGVVLSEIDTDDYPYWNSENIGNKGQENAILHMVANGSMRPTFSESCPAAILSLADQCLQVDPDDRPSAAEIVYALQEAMLDYHCRA